MRLKLHTSCWDGLLSLFGPAVSTLRLSWTSSGKGIFNFFLIIILLHRTPFFSWFLLETQKLIWEIENCSVVGLNFNYLLLNNTKHTLYLIYNTSLYFSPAVRFQYHEKYGFEQVLNFSSLHLICQFPWSKNWLMKFFFVFGQIYLFLGQQSGLLSSAFFWGSTPSM